MAGMSKDQIDADNIMPPERPIVIKLSVLDCFLNKKMRDPPRVVIKHGKIKVKIVASCAFILCRKPPQSSYERKNELVKRSLFRGGVFVSFVL